MAGVITMQVYLDNSATTRPSAEVRRMIADTAEKEWYNPSALYRPALDVQKRIDHTRETILNAAGAAGNRVIFTSGGTESDNLALLGHMRSRRPGSKVLISSVEHPAVSACKEELKREGYPTEEIPASAKGTVDMERLAEMMTPDTALISVMQVNNETGTVEPLEEIVRLRNRICPEAAVHVDGVQGFLRVPLAFNRTGIQSYAFSGHKIHALKGIGALICAKSHIIRPLQLGGGQESGIRSGTENTFGILSLETAIINWKPDDCDKIRMLKNRLWSEISARIPEAKVNGPDPADKSSAPHILNIALPPVLSQTMLFALEGDGIYVSAGSACASRKQRISPVLKAMGIPAERADCSLRFSLSRENTEEEILYTAERVAVQYSLLKKFVRR